MNFTKVLVANRGEIACRVIRGARALGYRTVAVFSDADAESLHASLADEAVHIGAAPAAESYLNIEALLDAARRTGADAVHPGYGFLSERADFAQACVDAGLVFVGPPAAAIRAMGDKAGAKRLMQAAGVPCAPGYLPAAGDADADSDERLLAEGQRLGLPLLVKAVAGGGGRGMRLVRALGELPAAVTAARREAAGAFGDGRLMLERLIEGGRHVEIQIFCDAHGQAVHLGERDCSTQRRRQKLIEEAPSPCLNPVMRAHMGADAVAAALAVGYVGAGTVEFIVDAHSNHHFLEMNTRLQVEHPVTEMLTGFDLVEWQLRVAAGEHLNAWLPEGQDSVAFNGHAIEARLYAEDPYDGFAPQTGSVLHWRPDAVAPGVRVDHGLVEGGTVTPHYDALLAKLVVHGHDRHDAIRRLASALEDCLLLGVPTNARFLRDLLQDADFGAATLTTESLDAWSAAGHPLLQPPRPTEADWLLAAALCARRGLVDDDAAGLRARGVASQTLALQCRGEARRWRVALDGASVHLRVGDASHTVTLLPRAPGSGQVRWSLDGVRRRQTVAWSADGTLHLGSGGMDWVFTEPPPVKQAARVLDPRRVTSPVAGTVTQVLVQPGERVQAGQLLVCVEAMKMEMWQHAQADGSVQAVRVKERDSVAAGTLLVELATEA